jgi:hypothetical protein
VAWSLHAHAHTLRSHILVDHACSSNTEIKGGGELGKRWICQDSHLVLVVVHARTHQELNSEQGNKASTRARLVGRQWPTTQHRHSLTTVRT